MLPPRRKQYYNHTMITIIHNLQPFVNVYLPLTSHPKIGYIDEWIKGNLDDVNHLGLLLPTPYSIVN